MLSKKKNKKNFNKTKYHTSVSFSSATSQEIHEIALKIFGSSYYIDYEVLTTSQSPMI